MSDPAPYSRWRRLSPEERARVREREREGGIISRLLGWRAASPPGTGYWLVRLVKKGPLVPAAIQWEQTTHEPGNPDNPMERSLVLTARINGEVVADWRRIWDWPKEAITKAEYEYRLADAAWAKEHAPHEAIANPRQPVALLQATLPRSEEKTMDEEFIELSPEMARRIGDAAPSLRNGDTLGLPITPGIGHNQPPLPDLLKEETAALAKRRDDLLGLVARVPEVTTEEDAKRAASLIKLILACAAQAKKDHAARKAPILLAGRQIDAAYKEITEPLDAGKGQVERKLTVYQRQKAEAERKAREEEARRRAEEAERQRREAEEAAAQLASENDLDAAIEAEERARQAAADAAAAAKASAASPAELSRTRSEFGAVASLAKVWTFKDLDRAAIDLEALRPYLDLAAIEKAVRLYIRSGARTLKGCTIFEDTQTRVR